MLRTADMIVNPPKPKTKTRIARRFKGSCDLQTMITGKIIKPRSEVRLKTACVIKYFVYVAHSVFFTGIA